MKIIKGFKVIILIIVTLILISVGLYIYIYYKMSKPLNEAFYEKYVYVQLDKYFTNNTLSSNEELRKIFLNDFFINKMCNIEYINMVCGLEKRDDYLVKGMLKMTYENNYIIDISKDNSEEINMYILEENMYKMLDELYDIPLSENITKNSNTNILKYMYYDRANKVFSFAIPKEEYYSKKLVYLKSLTKNGDKYIADISEYYLSYNLENFNENIKKIQSSIISGDLNNLNLIATNNENINVINKKITFSENPNGEYFKYKIFEVLNDSLEIE